MDHNMVLSYDYSSWNRRRQKTNAPPSQAISMAVRRRWSSTCGIVRCSMTRALPEATEHHLRATTGSVSPRRPPGWQQTANKTMMQHIPTLMDMSMVIVMRQYYTAHITRWRRSRAFIKATKRHHQASTCSDSINRTRQRRLFLQFHLENGSSWHHVGH